MYASSGEGKIFPTYTIACITVMLVSLLWFIGSHAASNPDTRTEKHHAPSDG